MRAPFRRIALYLLLVAAVSFGAGCAPQGDEAPAVLETEEVGPAPDAELDLSSDRKAKPRPSSAGQLPGSFPEGLPVYQPASISDLGEVDGREFVHFVSPDEPEEIRAWYRSELIAAGWAVDEGPGGELIATRAPRRANISIEDAGSVTLILVDY